MRSSEAMLVWREKVVFVQVIEKLVDDNCFQDLGKCRQNRDWPIGSRVLPVLPAPLEDSLYSRFHTFGGNVNESVFSKTILEWLIENIYTLSGV